MNALSSMEKKEEEKHTMISTTRRHSDSVIIGNSEETESNIFRRRLSELPPTPVSNKILYHILADDTTSSSNSSCTVPNNECIAHTIKNVNESIDDLSLSLVAVKGDILKMYKHVIDSSAEVQRVKLLATNTCIDVAKISKLMMHNEKMILAQNTMIRNCSIMIMVLLFLQLMQMNGALYY